MDDQTKFKKIISKLNNGYSPRIPKKSNEKNRVLESAKKLFDARDEIINLFEKVTFASKGNVFKTKKKEKKKKKKKNQKKNQKKLNFLNILRMNQKVLTMICLKNILNL